MDYISRYVHRTAQQGQVILMAHKIRVYGMYVRGQWTTFTPIALLNFVVLILIMLIAIIRYFVHKRSKCEVYILFLSFLSSYNSLFHIYRGSLNNLSNCARYYYIRN